MPMIYYVLKSLMLIMYIVVISVITHTLLTMPSMFIQSLAGLLLMGLATYFLFSDNVRDGWLVINFNKMEAIKDTAKSNNKIVERSDKINKINKTNKINFILQIPDALKQIKQATKRGLTQYTIFTTYYKTKCLDEGMSGFDYQHEKDVIDNSELFSNLRKRGFTVEVDKIGPLREYKDLTKPRIFCYYTVKWD